MAGLDRKRGADFIAMLQEIGGKVNARVRSSPFPPPLHLPPQINYFIVV